jgi:hypothetical protein
MDLWTDVVVFSVVGLLMAGAPLLIVVVDDEQ